MISFQLREETPSRQAPTETCLLPNGLNPHGAAIEGNIYLVTRRDPQSVTHRFRNHHLPLGADTVSHTDKYNFRERSRQPRERNASYVVSVL